MNISIATLLEQKGGAVYTVPVTVTVSEAVQEMNRHKVSSMLVMDGARLAGIFTERDVLRRVVGEQLDPLTTPVTQVMTGEVLCVSPDMSVQQLLELFAQKGCRHMPVMKGGRLLGVVSVGDLSRWIASAERAEAETLRQYISGGLSA